MAVEDYYQYYWLWSDLWRVDLDTGRRTRLTRGERATDPDVRPGGDVVAYVARVAPGEMALKRLWLDDGRMETLFHLPGAQVYLPRISPDGRRIAFELQVGARRDIAVWEDGRVVRVTNDDALDTSPEWLPDGRLLFSSDRTGIYDLYVFEAGPDGWAHPVEAPLPPLVPPVASHPPLARAPGIAARGARPSRRSRSRPSGGPRGAGPDPAGEQLGDGRDAARGVPGRRARRLRVLLAGRIRPGPPRAHRPRLPSGAGGASPDGGASVRPRSRLRLGTLRSLADARAPVLAAGLRVGRRRVHAGCVELGVRRGGAPLLGRRPALELRDGVPRLRRVLSRPVDADAAPRVVVPLDHRRPRA